MIRLYFQPYSSGNLGSGTLTILDQDDNIYFNRTYIFQRSWDGGHPNWQSIRLNINTNTTQLKLRLLKNSGFNSQIKLIYGFGEIMLY